MKDGFGREITYMRISVTDRCNLRCVYCMPDGVELVPHSMVLRNEEFVRIARCAASLGISHLKVTGGEPLVRRGVCSLIAELKKIPEIETVTLTTNGTLLKEHLKELKAAGIDGINISLDTLDTDRYASITGGGDISKVIDSIESSAACGIRTKVNVVSMRDTDPLSFLRFTEELPVDVRFIEMMPIGAGRAAAGQDNRYLYELIRNRYPHMERDRTEHGFGPAVYYRIEGHKGCVGFISAIHGKFCDSCNRVRLTSEGYLKTCLSYSDGVDLRKILREAERSARPGDDPGNSGCNGAAVNASRFSPPPLQAVGNWQTFSGRGSESPASGSTPLACVGRKESPATRVLLTTFNTDSENEKGSTETAGCREAYRMDTDRRLRQAMEQAIKAKPRAHCFENPDSITEMKLMAAIGG